MSQVPFVSAVICAYNYERYIAEAVDSALAQDYPTDRFEVIVVDDGSTDGTPGILAAYGDRIRVVRQANGGLTNATERGIRESRGELIALLDADDAWMPDKLRRQAAVFEGRPEVGLVYTDKTTVDADGEVIYPSWLGALGIRPRRGRLLGALIDRNFVGAPTIMFRSSLVPHVLPIAPEAPYQDHWLAVRIAEVAELDYVDAPLVRYRLHAENMTAGAQGDKKLDNLVRELIWRRWILTELPLDGVSPEELRTAWNRYLDMAQAVATAAGVALSDIVRVSPGDRAVWRAAMGAAGVFRSGGELSKAMRAYLVAMASDPFEPHARRAFEGCGRALSPAFIASTQSATSAVPGPHPTRAAQGAAA